MFLVQKKKKNSTKKPSNWNLLIEENSNFFLILKLIPSVVHKKEVKKCSAQWAST